MNTDQIKVTNRGAVRGVGILVDNFVITRTEAENAAILTVNFNLQEFHDVNKIK